MKRKKKKRGFDLAEGRYGRRPEAKSGVVCRPAAGPPWARAELTPLLLPSRRRVGGPARSSAWGQPAGDISAPPRPRWTIPNSKGDPAPGIRPFQRPVQAPLPLRLVLPLSSLRSRNGTRLQRPGYL